MAKGHEPQVSSTTFLGDFIMFRSFLMTLALISSTAFAADPVTERPTTAGNPGTAPQIANRAAATPNAAPAAQPVQQRIQVAGSVWSGSEQINNDGKLSFGLYKDGVAMMSDAQGNTTGRWTADGANVVITFDNCVYRGVIQGDELVGRATVTSGPSVGQAWMFRVAHTNPYAGREYNGQEQLNNFGKLTFRFAADGTVTMVDARSEIRGTYVYDVANVTIRFVDCEYVGSVQRDDSIRGAARFTNNNPNNQPWSFAVSPK